MILTNPIQHKLKKFPESILFSQFDSVMRYRIKERLCGEIHNRLYDEVFGQLDWHLRQEYDKLQTNMKNII